jgi:ribosomal protein S10
VCVHKSIFCDKKRNTGMYTVDLHIAGHTPDAVERASTWAMHVASMCSGVHVHVRPVPRRRHLLTLLRSPHVNKKSREQFMETTRGRVVRAQYTPDMAQIYVYLMERAHVPGVEMSMKVTQPWMFPVLYCVYI